MGKKKGRNHNSSSNNNNKKKKNKRGNNSNNHKIPRNQNQHDATVTSPPTQAPSTGTAGTSSPTSSIPTLSNVFESLSVAKNDNLNTDSGFDICGPCLEAPMEVGRMALVRNLKSRKEMNGQFVKIQKILTDGRVIVEHKTLVASAESMEQTQLFSAKAENIEVQWKPVDAGELCHICMDTVMFSSYESPNRTAGEFTCCGKNTCLKCLQATQQRGRTTCLFCNANALELSDSDMISNIRARAERGDADAMYQLALVYHRGSMGLEQDYVMSRKLFRKATLNGTGAAAYDLFLSCMNGHGGPVDQIEGLAWLHVASDLGNFFATTTLGWAYLHGFGVQTRGDICGIQRDIDKAKTLLQKSIDAGDERAIQVSKQIPKAIQE